MVGPGTGVAPFVGFVQHRQFCQSQMASIHRRICSTEDFAECGSWGGIDLSEINGLDDEDDRTRSRCLQCAGDMWLFYGCRHEAKDYLYKQELKEAKERDVIQRLDTAFSRDGPEKVLSWFSVCLCACL